MRFSWAVGGRWLRACAWGLCLATMGVFGCEGRTVTPVPVPPPEVTVAEPLQREIILSREFSGRVEAKESVEIRARVTGYITEVNFVEGDIVEEGTVLFTIDARPFQEALNSANAEIDRWKAAIAKNESDLARQTQLLKSGAGLQEDFDQAKALVLESKAGLSGAQADVEKAQLNLDFTKVTAPVKGRVGRALVTKGNLITADQTLGTPLTTLVSVTPMYVYFDVDEFTILEVRKQSRIKNPDVPNVPVREQNWPVFIGLANETGFPHEGFIDFVDNQVDTSTGTVRLRGKFVNTDEYLRAGLFVRVRVPLSDGPQAKLLVPNTAIGTDLNLKYVMVVNAENRVEKRPVELGVLTDDGLQVVESGLSESDWVVINGLQRVRDGGEVNATKGKITPPKLVPESE
ncbi:Efflux pump periplasmic linker BepF [Symmachiella dynata]|uniref:Efflux pump periplasmic linker BepF n=1 Tax=Symmachiella dynata TaxID=2527995 RepID=A0A517ZY35_9PLAN|nr:Efflux pump periplasmic linker BepF [Symmachiella dynata]QDU47365.1 Efflux pump periplasmic linker BepF [Symmachiella dynata]